jgi:hypothetical protein
MLRRSTKVHLLSHFGKNHHLNPDHRPLFASFSALQSISQYQMTSRPRALPFEQLRFLELLSELQGHHTS